MLFNDIKEREELSLDGEVFSLNWESQSVNPYGNIEIPERHDIDVSDYVSPCPDTSPQTTAIVPVSVATTMALT